MTNSEVPNSVHHPEDDPFFSPCCGVAIVGDIVFGETLCPYCESSFKSESESQCGNPCDAASPCDACEAYWERMRSEGLWRDGIGWSDAAISSMG